MLVRFFYELREAGIPVSLIEFLALLGALQQGVSAQGAERFYWLARLSLVKDERFFDRFDRVFATHFAGAERAFEKWAAEIPSEWLQARMQQHLTEKERRKVQALGGWEKLLETLKQRLAEQKERHQGGNKWVGTGGTSPFGSGGYNPEGIRIGEAGARQRRAVKVWEAREYRNFDDQRELGTRQFKIALRGLRKFARQGAADELDLDGTIEATARNAGWLDLKLRPERRNAVKVLLLLDVGGSMDEHVRGVEALFSAARSEFRHLEYFYFHNFIYEYLWKDNRRRQGERSATWELMRRFNSDYRVIIVGDASMSPYEILQPGGSVEHWNEESGEVWLKRVSAHFPHLIWLNPQPQARWDWTPSIGMTRSLVQEQMFPLSLEGLERAMRALQRPILSQPLPA